MKRLQLGVLGIIILISGAWESAAQLNRYNVRWDSPSDDSWGSMPVGNGDVGANFWITPDGEIHFYISKTDAWSENGRLLKIGKLKVRFTPNILQGGDFIQELDLESGTIQISGTKDGQKYALRFWVDANHPVLNLEGESSIPVRAEVFYDGWRREARELTDGEIRSAYGLGGSPDPVIVEADSIGEVDRGLIWYHRNKRSIWGKTIDVQALNDFADELHDPLINRTFGAYVRGKGLSKVSVEKLMSESSTRKIEISVIVHTAQASSARSWQNDLLEIAHGIHVSGLDQQKIAHENWWKDFWEKHYIFVVSEKQSAKVFSMTQGYLLQRYINACAGRGNMPIKFNGSIFTVDVHKPIRGHSGFDADFRDWGGCYWWQNTRLPYWAMLHSGDYELMLSLFIMYRNALPLAQFRTKKYYHHEGAMYPETMYFWGTWNNENYGWDRDGKPDGLSDNMYIRYEWQGAIELVAMMLDYYEFTQDADFLRDTLQPLAYEILTFYDLHYNRDNNGKLKLDPAQALETYWEGTINPMPEIAGLKDVTSRIIANTDIAQGDMLKKLSARLQNELPPLPTGKLRRKNVLMPAAILGDKKNVENPELYAIFPYRHFGVGKNDLRIAKRTYKVRQHKDSWGWQQDAIQAAYLGMTKEASSIVLNNFNTKHNGSRFPAFWGPNYDWVPDQDHGNVSMRALQNMLIQTDADAILLFPGWPRKWDVEFKVHAPGQTTIEGKLEHGKLIRLDVSPEHRKQDIKLFLGK